MTQKHVLVVFWTKVGKYCSILNFGTVLYGIILILVLCGIILEVFFDHQQCHARASTNHTASFTICDTTNSGVQEEASWSLSWMQEGPLSISLSHNGYTQSPSSEALSSDENAAKPGAELLSNRAFTRYCTLTIGAEGHVSC